MPGKTCVKEKEESVRNCQTWIQENSSKPISTRPSQEGEKLQCPTC